eukprot:3945777-Pyramimonas_sp.AAC.1
MVFSKHTIESNWYGWIALLCSFAEVELTASRGTLDTAALSLAESGKDVHVHRRRAVLEQSPKYYCVRLTRTPS